MSLLKRGDIDMIRPLDEMQGYFERSVKHLESLEKKYHNTSLEEPYEQLRLLSSNMFDAMDSIRDAIVIKDMQIADLNEDVRRLNMRTIQLINDVKSANHAVDRVKELEAQIDNLSDIILRSLKNLPVKGGEQNE